MKVSVITPVYNAELTLEKCLSSVIEQSFLDWEIIAIDDGSSDSSYDILKQFSEKDKRVRVFRHENCGPGETRNCAIAEAVGTHLVFLDADDYLEQDYFKTLNDVVEKLDPDIIFIDVYYEKLDGQIWRQKKMSRYRNLDKEMLLQYQMTGKFSWAACFKVVKKSLIVENNIGFSKDTVGEEAIYSFRIVSAASEIHFVEKAMYHYVIFPNSQSTKGGVDPWGDVCLKVRNYLEHNGLLTEFLETVNSLALTATLVSILRYSSNNSYINSVEFARLSRNKLRDQYRGAIQYKSLRWDSLLAAPFLLVGWVAPIVLAAKIKIKMKAIQRGGR